MVYNDFRQTKTCIIFGMTRNEAKFPESLRRCNKHEIEQSDMLDYVEEADKTEDGIYRLNTNESKSEMNECDVSTVSTLETTTGIGNVTPPKSVAFTGAEQSGKDCIGSGDLLGGSANKTKKYGVYRKKGNKRIRLNKGLSYTNAIKQASLLNEKNNTNEYKIYQIAD